MAKREAGLMSFRINDDLRQEFVRSARLNQESSSDALRSAIQNYVKKTRRLVLQREAEAIRADTGGEIEVLNWISAHGIPNDEG